MSADRPRWLRFLASLSLARFRQHAFLAGRGRPLGRVGRPAGNGVPRSRHHPQAREQRESHKQPAWPECLCGARRGCCRHPRWPSRLIVCTRPWRASRVIVSTPAASPEPLEKEKRNTCRLPGGAYHLSVVLGGWRVATGDGRSTAGAVGYRRKVVLQHSIKKHRLQRGERERPSPLTRLRRVRGTTLRGLSPKPPRPRRTPLPAPPAHGHNPRSRLFRGCPVRHQCPRSGHGGYSFSCSPLPRPGRPADFLAWLWAAVGAGGPAGG
jgi:hypothetical protein